MYLIIADTHMGHENIRRYCNRPDNFEEIVIENWRTAVKPEDVVIHLGDLVFDENWLRKMETLPGRKILLRGNHDRLPMEKYLEYGWLPMESMVLKLAGLRIVFSHRPMLGHAYDVNIHGHQHDLHVLDDSRLYLPVALEHTRYAPVPLTEAFLKTLRSYVERNYQPTAKEIHALLGSDRALEERDVYGGFGKESYEDSQKRLKEGFGLLCQPDAAKASRGYLRWHLVQQYVEGAIEFEELTRRVQGEICASGQ